MTEKQFVAEFVEAVKLKIDGCRVATHKSLLYDLTVDDDGSVRMGVDTDSGEPIRGRGKGFEQDILIHENSDGSRSLVPRVVVEVKFNGVTTHDTIVYSEKARRIRTVYPYIRYGFLLGGFKHIPGRVLRLGEGFDFIVALAYPFKVDQIRIARSLLTDEVQASRDLARMAFGKVKVTTLRRKILHESR